MPANLEPSPAVPQTSSDRVVPHGLELSWSVMALLAAAVSLLVTLVPPMAQHWRACRAYPFQLDAEEGFILGQALTLARGESIYQPLDRPPFLAGNYTPFFPWIYSLANGPRATLNSLPVGRALVELAALLAALGLALIALARTRRLLPALLAPLLFLASYEVYHWAAFVRVDLPALLFTVAGLGVFLIVRPRWGTVLAAVLFVAAAYTRQTAILAPLACAAALALHDRRRLAWFVIPYLGLGLLFFAWFQWRSGGEFFRHIVTYNQNQMDWAGWGRVMKNEIWFFYRWWILALAPAIFINFILSRMMAQTPPFERAPGHFTELPHARHAAGFYAALSLLSLVSYAKIGAAPNYALEPLAAAALWTAETLSRLIDRLEMVMINPRDNDSLNSLELKSGRARWMLRLGAWGLCLLLIVHGARLWHLSRRIQWSPTLTVHDRAAAREIADVVRTAAGDVLSEEPVFTLLAGKPVLLQPFITAQLAREGRWSDQTLLGWLERRRFGCVVTTEDLSVGDARSVYERYTTATAATLRQNYILSGQIRMPTLGRNYHVWLPREK